MKTSLPGLAGAVWGVGGVLALLLVAIARLAPLALEALDGRAGPLSAVHWLGLAASVGFFGYVEGYRAFQRGFSPRVVARSLEVLESPTPLRVLLAPAYCMGLFAASPRRMAVSWGVTRGVVVLVRLVGQVPQPWRGIVDLGVVVALGWGAVALLAFAAQAALAFRRPVPTDG